MASKTSGPSKLDRVLAEQRAYIAQREKGYREKALKLYPWICGRCSREFTRANLSELTVHHVDHNHDNNPSDGSNWELLCIYCHDEEHTKFSNLIRYGSTTAREKAPATHNPFADLKERMKKGE
ncbi:MAG: HNH nuclease family protein [Gammaproteobacteria bacterium]|uniref:YajD family HNH nuclease n=1 Tax=Pseudomaricurvus alcaniphilus TaxID=1166482 RepID=UPI00140D31A4|nr:YajD family HNH nuclease [Pseudomaricurvus alcaniphilus]MBR9912102.1 HNH nuclease family protein [Gammaproteobacteria bacterium]NHN35756.1 HNH nuclease family protein [Pseudomaricurvus alcaniphilus]